MRKWIIIIALILLSALGATYFMLKGTEFIVTIPEQKLQTKLTEKMPFVKTLKLLVVSINITFDNAEVDLLEGSDRVNMVVDVDTGIVINDALKNFGGTIDATAGVTYDASKGQFFLIDPEVGDLNVQGIPIKYRAAAAKAATVALGEFLKKYPVYTLKADSVKKAAARLVLRDLSVINEELVVTLGL